MSVLLMTLLLGIIMTVISLYYISKGPKRTNCLDQPSRASNYEPGSKTKFLASEVMQELEDNTDRLLEKVSQKELDMEKLLSKIDHKLLELNHTQENLDQQSIEHKALNLYTPRRITQSNERAAVKGVHSTNFSRRASVHTKWRDEETSHHIRDDGKYDRDEMVQFVPKYLEKHRQIVELIDKGYSITDIARETGRGKGEIQLICNLYKQSEGFIHEA